MPPRLAEIAPHACSVARVTSIVCSLANEKLGQAHNANTSMKSRRRSSSRVEEQSWLCRCGNIRTSPRPPYHHYVAEGIVSIANGSRPRSPPIPAPGAHASTLLSFCNFRCQELPPLNHGCGSGLGKGKGRCGSRLARAILVGSLMPRGISTRRSITSMSFGSRILDANALVD